MKKRRITFMVYDTKGNRLDYEYADDFIAGYQNAQRRWNDRPILLCLSAPTEMIRVLEDTTFIDIRNLPSRGPVAIKTTLMGHGITLFLTDNTGYNIRIFGDGEAFLTLCKVLKNVEGIANNLNSQTFVDEGPYHYHIPIMSSAPTRWD